MLNNVRRYACTCTRVFTHTHTHTHTTLCALLPTLLPPHIPTDTFNCSEEILTVAAMLQVQHVFLQPSRQKGTAVSWKHHPHPRCLVSFPVWSGNMGM